MSFNVDDAGARRKSLGPWAVAQFELQPRVDCRPFGAPQE
jgi:hypothetical protein